MFWHYLMVALRNLTRQKLYAVINIVGLALGITCCVLIMLFVGREWQVDRFHEKGERIYKVVQKIKKQGDAPDFGWGTPGALGSALKQSFPEIQEVVRLMRWPCQVESEGKTFDNMLCLTDQTIFDVFTFPLLKGNPTALADPSSVVITEKTAKRYFGDADPMGKVVTVHNINFRGNFVVKGILRDIPDESTIRFDMLVTDAHRNAVTQRYWENWLPGETIRPVETYLLLPEAYNPQVLEEKLMNFATPYLGTAGDAQTAYYLQPFHHVYLYARQDYGIESYAGIQQVYLLLGIAAFILVIACINFMNLATARSTSRAKEVGMRKVVGASRGQLVGQFLGESMLMAVMALLVAIGLAELFLPTFNAFVGRDLDLDGDAYGMLLPGLLGVTVLTGLLAGSYPAFFLSAYRPVVALKGTGKSNTKGAWFRKGLVTFQFAISVFLIVGTLVIDRQLRFMIDKDLGFDTENLIVLPIFLKDREGGNYATARLSARYEGVKQAFMRYPNVVAVSAFRQIPVFQRGGISRQVRPEGDAGVPWQIPVNEVDEDFFKTFGIPLVMGQNFSQGIHTGLPSEFIINETAAKQFGWDDPIGKQITWPGRGTGTVIGVVKDFHVANLHERIGPALFMHQSYLFNYIGVKVRPENLSETLTHLETTWQQLVPDADFSTLFLDEWLKMRSYGSERGLRRIASAASGLAILIACLGLFGLVSFTVVQRVKEIGVRKVLGASVLAIVVLLSKDFVILVVAANVITWPVAYYAMSGWLQNFPYHIEVGGTIFVLCGLLSLSIALITVSYQAWQAARMNPVDALRDE